MRKITSIAGRPGTGKTTLMRKIIDDSFLGVVVNSVPCLYSDKYNTYILGKYEDGELFAGTDRLSMSIQPKVIELIESTKSNILFEGDRLTNQKFYDYLLEIESASVEFVFLTVTEDELESRYESRGSDQSETFLKGRKTKIANLLYNERYVKNFKKFTNETIEDQNLLVSYLKARLAQQTMV